jgi:hypothetical protein
VIHEWLNATNNEPTFCVVEDVRKVNGCDEPAGEPIGGTTE